MSGDRNGKESGVCQGKETSMVCEKEQAWCLSGEMTNIVTVTRDEVHWVCQDRGQIMFCQGGGPTGCLSREMKESLKFSFNVSYKSLGCSE